MTSTSPETAKKAMSSISVSAVIVTWNSRSHIDSCLASLRNDAADEELEIIVVDNCSIDDTINIIKEKYPSVTCLSPGKNLGFAKAVNLAVTKSSGDYIFLLNPDARVMPGCAGRLAGLLKTEPGVAIAGPQILKPGGEVDPVCAREFPSLAASFFELFWLRRLFPRSRLFGRYRLEYWDHQSSRDVPCLQGSALMVRRSFLMRHGLLDQRIPMYFEDIDLCQRAWRYGWRASYSHRAQVVHLGGGSSALAPYPLRLAVLEQGEALWLYFRCYRGRVIAFAFSFLVFAGSLFRLTLSTFALLVFFPAGGIRRFMILPVFKKYALLLAWSLRGKDPAKVIKRLSWPAG